MRFKLLFIFTALPLVVSLAGAEKTVWDGVYTAAQAARGKAVYATYCSSCHMDDLSGGGVFGMEEARALRREGFMEGRDLYSIFTFIEGSMPADNPSTLTDEAYLDILAYILQQNAFPVGTTELTPSAELLKNIRIVAKPD